MRFFKHFIIFSLASYLILSVFATNISTALETAFKSGDSEALSKYFNVNIELSINNTSNILSKNQAKHILAEFFLKNQPTNFIENNSGGKSDAKFILGTLYCKKGIYQVSILLRGAEGNMLIHQINIEAESNIGQKNMSH